MHMRFFDYSAKAPDLYKKNLEKSVCTFDSASDGHTYTPYTSDFILAVFGVLINVFSSLDQNNEDETYKNLVFALQICVPLIAAASAFIKYVCGSVSDSAKNNVEGLIEQGVENGFFNTLPHFPDNVNNDNNKNNDTIIDFSHGKHQELRDLYIDANACRILHRKP